MMTHFVRGPAAAEPLYLRSIDLRRDLILNVPPVSSDEPSELASMELSRASRLEESGRTVEAERIRASLFAFFEEAVHKLPPETNRRGIAQALLELGLSSEQNKNRRDAGRLYRLALIVEPDNHAGNNNLAWLLSSRPEEPEFDPVAALPIARRAVEGLEDSQESSDGMIWNTLGVAEFRVGHFREAVKAFEHSMRLRGGGDPGDWFFLAMIHGQQGRPAWAWYWYSLTCQWLARNAPRNAEFQRFQKEATALIVPADGHKHNPRSSAAKTAKPDFQTFF
jgi:tetratricopeptide (TPR) repeat protein